MTCVYKIHKLGHFIEMRHCWHRAIINKYHRDKLANMYQNEITIRNQLILTTAIALDAIDLLGAHYSIPDACQDL